MAIRTDAGIVIGGLAVSLLGRPRVTRDVDVMVLLPMEEWLAFLDAGRSFGFVPRHVDAIEFAHEARVLLLRHTYEANESPNESCLMGINRAEDFDMPEGRPVPLVNGGRVMRELL